MDQNDYSRDVRVLTKLIQEIKKSGRLLWRLFVHPRVSLLAKVVPVMAFLYWLNPIDPLPPPLNITPIDDITAILLGFKLFIELCPPDLVAALRHEINYGKLPDDEVIDTSYRVIDDD